MSVLAAGVVSTPAPGAERRAQDAHSPVKGNTKKVLKVIDKPEVRLYRVGTTLKNSNSKLTLQVASKGILLSKPVFLLPTRVTVRSLALMNYLPTGGR